MAPGFFLQSKPLIAELAGLVSRRQSEQSSSYNTSPSLSSSMVCDSHTHISGSSTSACTHCLLRFHEASGLIRKCFFWVVLGAHASQSGLLAIVGTSGTLRRCDDWVARLAFLCGGDPIADGTAFAHFATTCLCVNVQSLTLCLEIWTCGAGASAAPMPVGVDGRRGAARRPEIFGAKVLLAQPRALPLGFRLQLGEQHLVRHLGAA